MKELKENSKILIVLSFFNLFILYNYIQNGKTLHGIGYFLFFYVSILIIYFFTEKFPPKNEIIVKNPKKEFLTIFIFTLLGILFISINFYLKSSQPNLGFLIKLPVIIGMFLFTIPIGILIYLLKKKYKIMELGLKTKPISFLFLGIFISGLTGLFSFAFNKNGIMISEAYKEFGGILGMILEGLIGAALVEEFMRFAIQSRFEKLFKLNGFNILFATIIWAFMHFPVNHFKGDELKNNVIYCIQIIPIGFVWGYLTHRTKSILPSVLVHGTNFWGLQNG